MPQYADIATIFYNLFWKNIKLNWTTDCDTAFKQLKHALVHTFILAMITYDASFVVKTDDSDIEVGKMLI